MQLTIRESPDWVDFYIKINNIFIGIIPAKETVFTCRCITTLPFAFISYCKIAQKYAKNCSKMQGGSEGSGWYICKTRAMSDPANH
jgi:hypothetical protein